MEGMTKVCRGCEREKPLTEFHKDRSRKDGYRERCKTCNGGSCSRCGQSMTGRNSGQVCKPCRQAEAAQVLAESLETGRKPCSKCKIVKPFDQFDRDQTRPDGRDSRCKACGKTVPCAGGCGRLMWPGTTPNPPVCRECRREARQQICEQCEQIFERKATPGKPEPRFCSQKCFIDSIRMYDDPRAGSKASTRARKLGHRWTWDGIPDKDIYERDGWECKISGCDLGLIPQDLRWPASLSATIDHIVPKTRAADDFPWDTAPNKRAAHLICNTRRGNRMTEEEIVMAQAIAALAPAPVRRNLVMLPWPKRIWWRPCRWCGDTVQCARPSRSEWTVCQPCSRGKCIKCGAVMAIVVRSRPPEERVCRECQLILPAAPVPAPAPARQPVQRTRRTREPAVAQAPDLEERLWWTTVRPGW